MVQDEPRFEVVAVPRTDRFDPDDDRWVDQVNGFYRELDHEVAGEAADGEGVERRTVPVEGTKGGVSEIILALGTAGTFTAAIQFFQAWLGKDKSRSLEISWREGGETCTVSLKGDSIDRGALEIVARAAAERIGGGGWATPSIEPS